MHIGMIGLGRMGANIVRRLMRGGHTCVGFDLSKSALAALEAEGMAPAVDLVDLVRQMSAPRVIWMMLPAGVPAGSLTDAAIATLRPHLAPGDILIDGGNAFYKDDVRRAQDLAGDGILYIDIGTSGGVAGLDRGYCMMVGGDATAVAAIDPILKTLAPGRGSIPRTPGRELMDPRAEEGYIHAGPAGSGHFVKMVHNGIEYGLMQAYAEGFNVLQGRNRAQLPEAERYDLNLTDIAEVWRRGSVVSSWLLDLTAEALTEDGQLQHFTGRVDDTGEGRWTLDAAMEEEVEAPVLAASLFTRFRSRTIHTFGEKVLSAMRSKFGGHVEHPGA